VAARPAASRSGLSTPQDPLIVAISHGKRPPGGAKIFSGFRALPAASGPPGAAARRVFLAPPARHSGRLEELVTSYVGAPSSPIEQSWEFDYLNRVSQYFNSSDEAINDGYINYDYDDINQLTEEDPGGTPTGYEYDPNGNRTMSGYELGPGNRLEADDRYEYTYDDEGNLTQRWDSTTGRILYISWDNRNRLVEIGGIKGDGGRQVQT
jgi:YD repeat-containing protein